MKDMLKQGVIRITIYLDLKSFYHIDIAPGIVRRKHWESQKYKIQENVENVEIEDIYGNILESIHCKGIAKEVVKNKKKRKTANYDGLMKLTNWWKKLYLKWLKIKRKRTKLH